MQTLCKKLWLALVASAFSVPTGAWAQSVSNETSDNTGTAASAPVQAAPVQNAPADAAAAEETKPADAAAAEETKPAAEETKPADTAAAEETKPAAEETKPAAEETKPAAEETKPADTAAAEETKPAAEETKPADADKKSLPDTIANQNTSREARKKAMKNLSNSYPVNGNVKPAAEKEKTADNSDTIKPRIIPNAQKSSERMPYFEHHGYFRTRLSAFGNYDLDTRGTSPVPAPLDSDHRGNSSQDNIKAGDADTLLGGNIRLRYSPTLHITESVRIGGTFDILDNLVLGTSPNGLRTNWGSDAFFTFNGASPVNSSTFMQNAISVKALYGEADTLIGTFRAGRVPAHWGLGIIYNDGGVYKRESQLVNGHGWQCLDCDSSDAVDRVEYQIRDPFFDTLYLNFTWDFVNSGLASYNLQQDSIGQAFDLSDNDDVIQFTLSLFDRPVSQQEIDERYRDLFETRTWTADWGIFFSYREQTIAPEPDVQQTGNGASSTYDMYKKEAEAYVIDLWGRFYVPLPSEVMMRLEAEFVGNFGSVKRENGPEGKERTITQIGFAFEAEFIWRDLITGLKTGVAWSDNMVYSGHSMIEQLDVVPMGSIMRFDPNYTVDTMMFRELMGGINNAWYINIYGEYKFPIEMPQMTTSLGVRLDLTTSTAIVSDATPGNAYWYGFEGNLKLFYDESDRFRFEIGAGIFVPGSAWENVDYPVLPSQSVYENSTSETYDPEIAWNVLANLYFMF